MDPGKLLKGLGTGHILVPHLDLFMQEGDFPDTWEITVPNHKYDDGLFHPSNACFNDPRALYFSRLDTREVIRLGLDQKKLKRQPISAQLRRTFDWGHMAHGYYGAILEHMGFVTHENIERKIYGFEGIGSGTADLVDVEIPGNGKWLVDMKTMNSNEFKRGPRVDTLRKWTAQVNCYMAWLEADQAMILAIEKDSPHGLKEFKIQRDDDLLDDIFERWSYVENCIAEGTPPPCLHGFGESCDLKDRCYFMMED